MIETIDPILITIEVPLPSERAFAMFTEHLALWWPRDYTWGRDALRQIGIEPHRDGMCFEIGPHGFRCDWGRVLTWEPPRRLTLAWQISPRREPVPDPVHASTVDVAFSGVHPGVTRVSLEHRDFARHGAGAHDYREAMASPQGWPLILDRYLRMAAPSF